MLSLPRRMFCSCLKHLPRTSATLARRLAYCNTLQEGSILGLQPRDKAAMLGVNTIEILLEKFTFSSHRRDTLLFLTANMAAVTSRTNEQEQAMER